MMRKLKKKKFTTYSAFIFSLPEHLIKQWKLFNTDNKGMEFMGISVQRIVYMSTVDR